MNSGTSDKISVSAWHASEAISYKHITALHRHKHQIDRIPLGKRGKARIIREGAGSQIFGANAIR